MTKNTDKHKNQVNVYDRLKDSSQEKQEIKRLKTKGLLLFTIVYTLIIRSQ